MLDLLIRGARIIDGTGAPWFEGAVGIRDGRFAGIYEAAAPPAREEVSAEGCYLTPGFIDTHTHDDIAVLRDGMRVEKVAQGVTTIVTGNCSFSAFPFRGDSPDGASSLRQHLGSLVGTVADDEVFASFDGYRTALTQRGLGPNIVGLVGHGALRLAVLGYSARPANAEEQAEMANLLSEQLGQGAAGLSLGLVYPPSAWADDGELLTLAKVVAKHGRVLAAHIRNYDDTVEAALEEFLGLLRSSGAKGLLSHLQVCGRGNWGKMPVLLDRLEDARREGIDVACDMYPYTAGSSTILQLLPPSAQVGGIEAVIERLNDADERDVLRKKIAGELPGDPNWSSKAAQIGWENIRVGGVEVTSHRHYEGRSFADAAGDEGREPFEVAADLICCDCGQTNIIMFQQDEADLRKVLGHRLHMTGSDSIPREGGKPHPRSAGSFPRLIGHHALGNNEMSLEEAVRRMTALPAQRFALWDRGLIRPGMTADFALFGGNIRDQATYDEPRLPPVGVEAVYVGGRRVMWRGTPANARPGQVLSA